LLTSHDIPPKEAFGPFNTSGDAARRRIHRRCRDDELALLETAATENGEIRAFAGETRLFIIPGYRFFSYGDACLIERPGPRS
jgi:hypothetical protein